MGHFYGTENSTSQPQASSLTISELITLLHNQETTKTNSTNNNRTTLATSTESTINYHKKNYDPFSTPSINLSPHYDVSLSTTTTQKKFCRLIYESKSNPENSRTKSREKRKKSITSYVIA